MIVVLGWRFMAAEAIAALIMVAILVLLFRSECERKCKKQMGDFIDDYQGHRAQRDACFVRVGHEHRRAKACRAWLQTAT